MTLGYHVAPECLLRQKNEIHPEKLSAHTKSSNTKAVVNRARPLRVATSKIHEIIPNEVFNGHGQERSAGDRVPLSPTGVSRDPPKATL
ncbi:hypothetical protein EVAR_32894_1 [Eumeta japonica]|uniref:Uncharacterized protein n=1 Tax=Eumeta variegata TaxID=151549 RepID=A0A4C1VRQ5_EUMVA|nr:hypothetical protein EVAR_32894_1 [Eumeta japonica]